MQRKENTEQDKLKKKLHSRNRLIVYSTRRICALSTVSLSFKHPCDTFSISFTVRYRPDRIGNKPSFQPYLPCFKDPNWNRKKRADCGRWPSSACCMVSERVYASRHSRQETEMALRLRHSAASPWVIPLLFKRTLAWAEFTNSVQCAARLACKKKTETLGVKHHNKSCVASGADDMGPEELHHQHFIDCTCSCLFFALAIYPIQVCRYHSARVTFGITHYWTH